jgi:hypothetical protein
MIQVSMVPKELVDSCWEQVEPYMEKASKYTYGRYTCDDIYDSVKEHDYQLWIAFEEGKIKGAVVTNAIVYPKRKLLAMQFCGGIELKEWKAPMLALLQRFARDIGCDGIESTGRPGWSKVFKNDGFKEVWMSYELPIGE